MLFLCPLTIYCVEDVFLSLQISREIRAEDANDVITCIWAHVYAHTHTLMEYMGKASWHIESMTEQGPAFQSQVTVIIF